MSQPDFHVLLQAVADAVITCGREGRILYANPATERLLGWTHDELMGMTLTAIMPERLHAAHSAGMQRYFQTHEARILGRPVRVPGRRKDGTEIDIELTLSTMMAEDGTEQVIGVMRDMRDRTELERQLAVTDFMRSATALAAEISSHRDVQRILVATVDSLVNEFGAALARVWLSDPTATKLDLVASAGLSTEIVRSSRRTIDIATHPFKVGHVARTRVPFFRNGLAGEPGFDAGWVADNHLVAVAAVPLLIREELRGVYVAFFRRSLPPEVQDVLRTVATLLVTSLDDARLLAQLAAAGRAKDEFFAMLGHELRNPLAPILTAVAVQRARVPQHGERERKIIERQGRHLMTLVDDLLDISKVTSGKVALSKQPLEIANVIASAVEMTGPLIEELEHRVIVDVATSDLVVEGDETRLAQVFANILTNAAKYTRAGGEIHVYAEREHDAVVVRVRDNGIGIDAELLPRLFDLFVQGKRDLDRKHGGLGLGLALVRSFVELHGGTVSVRSEGSGLGSEFEVRLPAYQGELPVRRPSDMSIPAPPELSPDARLRILLVDDNADAVMLLGDVLEERGHIVKTAVEPIAALEEAEHFAPQVAVLDIGLPVMDGYALARALVSRLGDRAPTLIALSGYGQDLDRARSLEAGFAVHLVKPVDVGQLLDVLADCASRHRP